MSAISSALDELFTDNDNEQSPSELASDLTSPAPRGDHHDSTAGSPVRSGLYVLGIRRVGKGNLSPVARRVGGIEGEEE